MNPAPFARWTERGILGAACVLVIGVYSYAAHSGALESLSLDAADAYYNLLVQGFRSGQVSLKKEVPPGFTQLADPYDPAANARFRSEPYKIHDMSYYKGRLYLYFGVTPALILFWPYTALTGHYLFHRQAVVVFCALGFLASVALLRALWRRYFPEVSLGAVAACVLALGLATGVPVMLSRSDVYEVPISCGYLLTMLALGAIWCALHQTEPRKRSGWLASASLAYGLALGARPNLLFGAVILLVPVAQTWREPRKRSGLLLAAIAPILAVGLALMLYNHLRFGNPFEFGARYQLGPARPDTVQYFSLRYLWFNFRVYFLEPVHWGSRFPFVGEAALPPVPPGHHGNLQGAFGVLTNIPLVWLAPLGVGLAWRRRSASTGTVLRWFVAVVGLLFGMGALTVGLFFAVALRHEVDFLPAMVVLAVVGILGLERALAPNVRSGLADRPVWQRAARWGWGLLLGFSVAFNLLAGVGNYVEAHNYLGNTLSQAGRLPEAIGHYEKALRIKPDFAEAHNNLGSALKRVGKTQEAIGHYEEALRLMPDCADAHNNLGTALLDLGKVTEAMAHYEQALRIKPDFAEVHLGLGTALTRVGRVQEAIEHFQEALRIKPDYAEAYHDLGDAFQQLGRVPEAIGHYEQALRIDPDLAEAHNNLGIALQRVGRVQEAIGHFQQALRIKPDYVEAHYNLGVALEQAGRAPEAIGHYQQALGIKPDFAAAQNALTRLRALR